MNPNRDMYNQSGSNMPIAPGTKVYDLNGDKIGSVLHFDAQANYLVVEKGVIFTRDLYIPVSAIDHTTTDGISLNLSKDDLKDDLYATPPTYGTSGMRTTDEDILP